MDEFLIIGLEKIGSVLDIHKGSVKRLRTEMDLPIWRWRGRWVILTDDLRTWLIHQRNKNLDNKIKLALFTNNSQ